MTTDNPSSLVPTEPRTTPHRPTPEVWAHPAPEDGRPHQPHHHPEWTITPAAQAPPPSLVAAQQPTGAPQRPRRWPFVSVGLYALGQVALAVAIAFGEIGAVVGIMTALLWLMCGLALITAQVIVDNDLGRGSETRP